MLFLTLSSAKGGCL